MEKMERNEYKTLLINEYDVDDEDDSSLFSDFDEAMEDIVSEFIIGTFLTFPKVNTNVFDSMHSAYDTKSGSYFVMCGSCAEFFIQPPQKCFGDIDFFAIDGTSLAFVDANPELPYDLRFIAEDIYCLLMEPYLDYPGFVRLRYFGIIRYDWERKAFEFIQCNAHRFLETETEEVKGVANNVQWHKVGPATRLSYFILNAVTTNDVVISIWCPKWPNEAREWPNRHRKYGWPTTVIIHEVVQNGCHVVYAKHPAFSNDPNQCRLSFSIAEIILLQSWTAVQQIVYHMLRFFAKRELIIKDCPKDDEVLCPYHLKTLMLWSCEEMPQESWNSLTVIESCCNLLKKLATWLKDARCPNYFISHANLFHEHFNRNIVDETVRKLIYYNDSKIVSLWFLEHYMQPVCRLFDDECTHDDILSLEYVAETRKELEEMYPTYIDCYFASRILLDLQFRNYQPAKSFFFETFKYTLRLQSPFEGELNCLPLPWYESCDSFCGSMLRLLLAAHLMQFDNTTSGIEWCSHFIRAASKKTKFIKSKYHHFSKPIDNDVERRYFFFLKALDLMENLTGSSEHLEFQVVSDTSKVLLSLVLRYDESETNTLASLSYLAAIHFATSEYDIVIDLCSRVILNEKVDDEDTETLNAGCLLYIESISKAVGFYLIFRKIKFALYYTKRQIFLDLRLTPDVFAQHLRMSSIELTEGPSVTMTAISKTPKFPLDAFLVAITNHRCSQTSQKRNNVLCVYRRTDRINSFEETHESYYLSVEEYANLLMEFSLENMTSFYNVICQDFDIHCNTADSYRAAYLYKRRKYYKVWTLCERILNEPDLRSDLKKLAFANIIVLPPFNVLFDTDVQCLLGIQALAYYLLPSNEHLGEGEASELSKIHSNIAQYFHSGEYSLSNVLSKPYVLKRHYFLGRHFLARYLKVRCLIDCNCSLLEIMLEFKKLKACLPFEHIISCLLKQKLLQFYNLFMLRMKYNFD